MQKGHRVTWELNGDGSRKLCYLIFFFFFFSFRTIGQVLSSVDRDRKKSLKIRLNHCILNWACMPSICWWSLRDNSEQNLKKKIEKNGAPPCGLLHCELTKRNKDLAELHSVSPWNKRVYSTFSSVNSNPIVPRGQVFASLLVSTEVDRRTFSTSVLPSSRHNKDFFFCFVLFALLLFRKQILASAGRRWRPQ